MNKVDLITNLNLPLGKFEVCYYRPEIKNLVSIRQTHSDIIKDAQETYPNEIEGDGIILKLSELKSFSLAIKTADCLPIIILGNKGVCLIHAGWAGLKNKILYNKKIEEIEPYYAYIGPSIQVNAFEVQEDFRAHFKESQNFKTIKGKLYFNLQAEASNQLARKYSKIKIEMSKECTYSNKAFNSYRRDKTTKRNWNIFTV